MASAAPDLATLVKEASDAFRTRFAAEPQKAVFAPGRVNLIGEHTDYNDGFVLPMALPLATVIVGRKVEKKVAAIFTTSSDIDEPRYCEIEICDDKDNYKAGKVKWANYIIGVMANFKSSLPGFEAVVTSSVPVGGGLSSSASIEVATYTFLETLTSQQSTQFMDKAIACQKAEHNFANVPCGIMDQYISVMGEEGNALLIDCRSLTATLIPISDPNLVILITNSNVKHNLSGSEYPTRRKQCFEAASIIKKPSLRDATIQDLTTLEANDAHDDVVKRARHVINEISRTEKAASALKAQDFETFGKLMVQSHNSLRDDYEVSCQELDCIVEAALEVEGVLGSRMTGGGFGGCTVTLLQQRCTEKVIDNIKCKYKGQPTFYICKPSSGSKVITDML